MAKVKEGQDVLLAPGAMSAELGLAAPARMTDAERALILLAAKAEKDASQELKSLAERDAIALECGKSAQQRTQEQCDALYKKPGVPLWLVSLPRKADLGDPGMPSLVVPAEDPEAAIGRYNKMMNIRYTKHEHVAVPYTPPTEMAK